ncbi:MAG: DUF2764 family protein [Bacteroidales bacterium]|nr:DUF2764 family protein [Bacteroidales bacterium]
MANYEYIIASLPSISKDWKFGEDKTLDTYIQWVKSQLSAKDVKTVDTLLDGYKEENLNKGFYEAALKDDNRFIREYFSFDLGLRNLKARFLNEAFGRPANQDTINLETGEFKEAARVSETLAGENILAREKGLDAIVWEKISELTTFNYFDLDALLGIIAKMRLIERWRALDDETGREMFQQLIKETTATFGGVSYTAPQNE